MNNTGSLFHLYVIRYQANSVFSYLMQNHVGVRDQIVRIRAEIALNTRVFLQHRGLLFAFSANFASAPDIISQIMLAHYLQHAARPRLLNEGFRLQHSDGNSRNRLNLDIFRLNHL